MTGRSHESSEQLKQGTQGISESGASSDLPMDIREEDALQAVMAEYERLIQQAVRAHEALSAKVESLSHELEHKNRLLARQERLAALGEMAAGVAHEIRNPLGGISLYLEMLRDDVASVDGAVPLCDKIGNAVTRLNHIVEQILGFTRQLETNLETLQTQGLLEDVADAVRAMANDAGCELCFDIDADVGEIKGDTKLLHQVLLNLARNACEVAESQVTLSAHRVDETIALSVRDDGPGIDEATLPKLFTPFFTTKANGTGLGLAISQRIAEAHGGNLRVISTVGHGASFVLTIPSPEAAGK